MLQRPKAGPANVTVLLTTTGMYYFADAVTNAEQRNCDAGMQITVSVNGVCPAPPPTRRPPRETCLCRTCNDLLS